MLRTRSNNCVPFYRRFLRNSSAACRKTHQQNSSHGLNKRLKETADAVIIGGGIVGCSVAYHLAKAGMKDVVLLEKSELTAGSTWHAAGATTYFNPGRNMKKIHYYGINLYNQLEKETGQDIGFHRVGSVRLATSQVRVDEFRYQMSRHGWHQAPQWLITPEEIQQRVPIINMDKILGGLYNPDDGYLDPYSLTQALAIGARKHGGEIYVPVPVKSTTQREDGRWDVSTDEGTIIAKHVINAAGFHSREVAKMADIDLPVVPIDHQYVVTSAIPEVAELKQEIPVLRDLDSSYAVRMERQGLLISPYENEDKMQLREDWAREGVPLGFGKELFQPDVDRIYDNLEKAMEMFPCLRDASIQTVVSGPITYSVDALPTLGPMWDRHNYWLAVGTGYGIIHGGGCGKYLSDWIMNGEPPYDLIETDPGRSGDWCHIDYALKKTRETYAKNNMVGFPKEERWAGRPTARVSGVYQKLKDGGAEYGFHAGWEQPTWFAQNGDDGGYKPSFRRTNWFEPVGRECRMVFEKGGIIDLTPFGKINVKGKDATAYMDHIVANKLPEVNTTRISHMLTPTGKVYAELTVTRLCDDEYFCVTGSGFEFHDYRWMQTQARAKNFDVTVNRVTDDIACLGIAGPKSRDVMANLSTESMSNEDFGFLQAKRVTVGGVATTAIRISYTGELGWELYHKPSDTVTLYDALMAVGKEHGVGNFGTYALNSLRLEKGFRAWGHEMNVDTNPLEAGLEKFVKLKKEADFIGKTALQKIKADELNRRLAFMTVDTTDVDCEGNETIWFEDKAVGNTTSGAYGYQINKSVCFGYLPMELQAPGTQVQVELVGERYVAIVLKAPHVMVESMRSTRHLK